MTQPHTLLAKALTSLTLEEQGEVLKSLLPVALLAGMHGAPSKEAAAGYRLQHFQEQIGSPDQTSLLVRVPASVHAELKAWSEANGHSMNTVIRGLLERFLEAQRTASGVG